ncbi:MAG: DUF1801 domain-containing protein [Polyangiales bacterium]|nr:DUF1801 domain-containing protein [Myxococcales bacterium]
MAPRTKSKTSAKPKTSARPKAKAKPKLVFSSESATRRITKRIKELGDWRGERLAEVRAAIRAADPGVVEEWKWMGTPVWSHDGIVCTGETYKQVVKLTFMKGASLKDPKKLFNSSLDGNARRAIDIREADKFDVKAFQALFKQAVAHNRAHPPKSKR